MPFEPFVKKFQTLCNSMLNSLVIFNHQKTCELYYYNQKQKWFSLKTHMIEDNIYILTHSLDRLQT
jgi:hypothetical protein